MFAEHSVSGNLPTAEGEVVEAVWLEDLARTDYLLIRTNNAAYRFKIIDFEQQRGILSGGQQNNKPLRATLLIYQRKPAAGAPDRCPALQVGLGATFDVSLPDGTRQVITSPVTEVVIVRVGKH